MASCCGLSSSSLLSLLLFVCVLSALLFGGTAEELASLPRVPPFRRWYAATALRCPQEEEEKLHILGGRSSDGTVLGDHWIFSLGGLWDQGSCSFPQRYGHAAVSVGASTIVVTGGYSPSIDNVDDPKTLLISPCGSDADCGVEVATPFSARWHHSLTLLGDREGRALLYGGRDEIAVFGDTWEFNYMSRQWFKVETGTMSPGPRFGHSAVWACGTVFLFGGAAQSMTPLESMWQYDAEGWTEIERTDPSEAWPAGRYFHASVAVEDGFLVSGGTDGSKVFTDTWLFSCETEEWTYHSELPAKYGHVTTTLSSTILAFGAQEDKEASQVLHHFILAQVLPSDTTANETATEDTQSSTSPRNVEERDFIKDRLAPTLTGLGIVIFCVGGIVGLACFFKRQG